MSKTISPAKDTRKEKPYTEWQCNNVLKKAAEEFEILSKLRGEDLEAFLSGGEDNINLLVNQVSVREDGLSYEIIKQIIEDRFIQEDEDEDEDEPIAEQESQGVILHPAGQPLDSSSFSSTNITTTTLSTTTTTTFATMSTTAVTTTTTSTLTSSTIAKPLVTPVTPVISYENQLAQAMAESITSEREHEDSQKSYAETLSKALFESEKYTEHKGRTSYYSPPSDDSHDPQLQKAIRLSLLSHEQEKLYDTQVSGSYTESDFFGS